ncbi:unnamed protein product [Penicillium salamii]|nr:unnamed protein product [Penicillium salamii]CAG8315450.1 unnamed protein product [Penicillium salamii]
MAAQVDTASRSHGEYIVGWVCALPKEQTAAIAMLDQRHVGLPKPRNDPNTYTLGSVGSHNVVIACLPKGHIGNNSAANVASWMISTFPSIKFGLMVGIGGGVPPKVRLGDVVVSTPVGQFPGVVQWDLGKARRKLRPDRHDLAGSKIPEYLEELREKWPRIVPKYLPSDLQDVLFKADYGHVSRCASDLDDNPDIDDEDEDAEGSCRLCDKMQIVRRKPRDMSVHFGLIASGNQVIKDAYLRNKLNKDLDGHLLCIEMEAAGLMNNFPCILIRGICDYADSHKNKNWQEYAAAVAAAFAKELLAFLQPTDVEGEQPVNELLRQVLGAVSQSGESVKILSSHLEQKNDLEILNWMTQISYGPQQSDLLGRRQRGTGRWLLQSTHFETWKEGTKQTMFCPGMPGAGKTFITAIVVDHLEQEFRADPTIGIAYVYCNFKQHGSQKINDLLAALLKQLAGQCQPLPDCIKDLYKRHINRETRPSTNDISKVLHSIVATFLKVSSSLMHLTNASHLAGCNITDRFEDAAVSLEIRATDEDVGMYLESQMEQLRPCVLQDRQLQREIKISISDAVDGMFLLAKIYLGFLDDKLTANDIRKSLKSFLKQDRGSSEEEKTMILSHAYDQVMERIDQQRPGLKQLAVKVLSWITCANRPLGIQELQYALAIKEGSSQLDEGDLPHISDMVSVCLGLITIDDESGIIRLVHYTTQEYLTRNREDWVSNAHTEIAKTCVTCLYFDIFETGPCRTHETMRARLQTTALYDYAANNWGYHARDSPSEQNGLILDFLQNTSKVSASRQAMTYDDMWSNRLSKVLIGLISPKDWRNAEHLGLAMSRTQMLDQNADIDCQDEGSRIPDIKSTGLHLAAHFGLATSTLKMLERKADIDSQDEDGRTPLLVATEHGHDIVARLLLDSNAAVSSEDEIGRTPLLIAVVNRHTSMVKLLLKGNAAIDSQDKIGRTPLLVAVRNGDTEVVRLLLNKNAAVDIPNKNDQTPLLVAAENGYDTVVKLLLERNPSVNFIDSFARTPLLVAVRNGYDIVARLLLESNAAVDSQDEIGRTPISFAVENGYDAIVMLLLSSNCAVDLPDRHGQTPLSQAAQLGHQTAVGLLLERNANVDSQDQIGRTPISFAAENGHDGAVKLLLNSNSTVDLADKYGQTPLSWAAENGHDIVVKLLLDRNAAVDVQDIFGQTPLSFATQNGHAEVVSLLSLLSKGKKRT